MSVVHEKVRHCAGLFRLGRDVEGSAEMVALIEELLALFGAPHLQQPSAALLGQMLAAQQRQDWIGVADSLEYEMAELIDQAVSR